MDVITRAALDALHASERDAYEADPIARLVGEVVLHRFGGYTVRQAIGRFGCIQIANAIRQEASNWKATREV